MNEKEFRSARVYFQGELAGYLLETNQGYRFVYDERFLKKGMPISVALPFRKEPFDSKELFSFFHGLLPEGWYLDLVRAVCKIDPEDKFGILLATTSADTIGAVTVVPER